MDEPSRHSKQALPSRLAAEVVPSSSEGAAPAPSWWCCVKLGSPDAKDTPEAETGEVAIDVIKE
jgi:hypothetical protein